MIWIQVEIDRIQKINKNWSGKFSKTRCVCFRIVPILCYCSHKPLWFLRKPIADFFSQAGFLCDAVEYLVYECTDETLWVNGCAAPKLNIQVDLHMDRNQRLCFDKAAK